MGEYTVSRGPATLSLRTQTPTTVDEKGLPLAAFQSKGVDA